ncbi:MAG: hypothetical protein R3341_04000 [Methylophaga sp.]|nr:hypothetical protein [Methylophaga sp.]
MKTFLYFLFLMLMSGLYGCGNQVALSGKAYDDYQKALKPYAYYWEKPEMTLESRRLDSWECGAGPTIYAADNVVFSPETEAAERKPEEDTNMPANSRLSAKWVQCMKYKGYVWIKDN